MSTDNIKLFIQTNYSDSQLAALIEHTESGNLKYHSCSCLVGFVTSTHAYEAGQYCPDGHYGRAVMLPYALQAEKEFHDFGMNEYGGSDSLRRERLLPILYAEVERREQERDYEGEEEPWSDSQGMIAMVNSIKGR